MDLEIIRSKIKGCLFGLAIGDAMGMPTSFLTPELIRKQYGWVDRFYPPLPKHIYHDGLKAGEFTDDTEQSLALAKSFIRMKKVVEEDIVSELISWSERTRGKYASPLGPSTQRAIDLIRAGTPLEEAGKAGDTNGSSMRISPLGIIHGVRNSPLNELLGDVVKTCRPTHGTRPSISAAAAVAWGIALSFQPGITMDELLIEMIKAAEKAEPYGVDTVSASVPKRIAWVVEQAAGASNPREFIAKVYEFLGVGVASADSVPAAIGLFAFAKGDPSLAISLGVNMGGDCDTVASIAGALAGTYAGVQAIPETWRKEVSQVNHLDLDNVVNGLIEASRDWEPTPLDSIRYAN